MSYSHISEKYLASVSKQNINNPTLYTISVDLIILEDYLVQLNLKKKTLI